MLKEKLVKITKQLEFAEAVIVDEMSMVSVDNLYNLHRRLMEIFESKDEFGGRALMLVGDLLQLPPVRARAIFKKPKAEKNRIWSENLPFLLWALFATIGVKNLTQIPFDNS